MNDQDGNNRIGSLWVKTSKGGTRYMSGIINVGGQEIRVVVFRNKQKRSDKSPDMSVFISKPAQPQGQPRQQAHQQNDIF